MTSGLKVKEDAFPPPIQNALVNFSNSLYKIVKHATSGATEGDGWLRGLQPSEFSSKYKRLSVFWISPESRES